VSLGLCGSGPCPEPATQIVVLEPLGRDDAQIDLRRAVPMCDPHAETLLTAPDCEVEYTT
jgi:hypothetical protein